MLFPLGQELQCEDIGQRVKDSDPDTETEHTKEASGQSLSKDSDPEVETEEKQAYKGPVTRTSQCLNGSLFWYLKYQRI